MNTPMLVADPTQQDKNQQTFGVIQNAKSKLHDVFYITFSACIKRTYLSTTSQLPVLFSYSHMLKTVKRLDCKCR